MFHVEQRPNSDTFSDFLVEGLRGFGLVLSHEELRKLNLYYEELCRWDRSINLTGLKTDLEKAVLLYVDSLACVRILRKQTRLSIVDIGTGGGFPGIPLKILFPDHQFFLMEPREKKATFLRLVIGKLGLKNISLLQCRLEEVAKRFPDTEKCDVGLVKAVNVDKILPFAKNILKNSGRLVVFRSKNIENRSKTNHMVIQEEHRYELPYNFGSRVLSILKFDD